MLLWQTREDSLAFLKERHPSRLDVIERTFALFDDIVDAYEAAPEHGPYARLCAVALLKAKNYAVGAFGMILDGHGQEAGALLRPMIEYAELITYLRLFPEKVELALQDRLPKAGERARAIDSVYQELRKYLNENASHSTFKHTAIRHVFDFQELRLRKRQSLAPHVLLTNLTTLVVQLLVLLTEAMYSLEKTHCVEFIALAERFDRLKARMLDVYGLKKDEPYTGG
jgi:hypothetical protein